MVEAIAQNYWLSYGCSQYFDNGNESNKSQGAACSKTVTKTFHTSNTSNQPADRQRWRPLTQIAQVLICGKLGYYSVKPIAEWHAVEIPFQRL